MHILIVNNSVIPALKYGGTERVIWWLGKRLVKMGHKVSYLVAKGSWCPFADVYGLNPAVPFNSQVPATVDVVHLLSGYNERPVKPYIITMQGNLNEAVELIYNLDKGFRKKKSGLTEEKIRSIHFRCPTWIRTKTY